MRKLFRHFFNATTHMGAVLLLVTMGAVVWSVGYQEGHGKRSVNPPAIPGQVASVASLAPLASSSQAPVALPPLPEVCKPWRPSPDPKEPCTPWVKSSPGMKGFECHKRTCGDDNEEECLNVFDMNLSLFVSNLIVREKREAFSHGGRCIESENDVDGMCTANIADFHFTIVERLTLRCMSRKIYYDGKGCKILMRTPQNIPQSEEDKQNIAVGEAERCDRLEKRLATCRPFCEKDEYNGQCMMGWGHTCKDETKR